MRNLPILLGLFSILSVARAAQSSPRASDGGIRETRSTTPANRSDLLSFQARVQASASKVMPAIVAIRGSARPQVDRAHEPGTPLSSGSGVIITSDGVILSQSHVSHGHAEQTGERKTRRLPGDRVMVILSDGREHEAELLGADQALDLSVLRIIKPGLYPHVSVSSGAPVGRGDWVLKIGHPLGYKPNRPPVVRLGRVLYQNEDMFVTDCLNVAGDSGGPLFDLEGRFVGLVASSMAPSQLNASLYCEDAWRFGPFSSTTARLIETYLDPMLHRQVAPYDRQFFSQFVGRYQTARDEEILPRAEWTQGDATSRTLTRAARVSGPTVVIILDEANHDVSLGTNIDAAGWVMAPASRLPPKPRCRLSDSRVVSARLVGIKPDFDLALLKVEIDLPTSPTWRKKPLVAGTILASIGPTRAPIAFGVVSVPERNMPGPFSAANKQVAGRPPILFGEPADQGFLVRKMGECCYTAGIRPGDVILSIDGKQIKEPKDLFQSVADRWAGEWVSVRLDRQGKSMEFNLELAGKGNPRSTQGFPTFFEHDTPLHRRQCGGPVVDLDGDLVGITVCPSEYGCMAIPGANIRRLFEELKSDRLTDKQEEPQAVNQGAARK
jgi:S1-C subfamily serine protease